MTSFNDTRQNRETANAVVIRGEHLEDEVDDKIISSENLPRGRIIEEFYMCHQIEEIADDTFADESNLTIIEFSPNLRVIGDNAFQGCVSLGEVNIPRNVERIGNEAFEDCSSYLEINFANFEALGTIGNFIFGDPLVSDPTISLGFTSTKEEPNEFLQWNCYTRFVQKAETLSTGNKVTFDYEYPPGELLTGEFPWYYEQPMNRYQAMEPYINLPTSQYNTLDIVISLSTLNGDVYEVRDFFKQENGLYELATEQHPELNDPKNPWSFVIPGVETPVKNLTCLQLIMKDIDEDDELTLTEPIFIVWDDVDE